MISIILTKIETIVRCEIKVNPLDTGDCSDHTAMNNEDRFLQNLQEILRRCFPIVMLVTVSNSPSHLIVLPVSKQLGNTNIY